MSKKIFISHRSTDKEIADMLLDFLVGTGIPKECIFCSSLPGNDVQEKIVDEVKWNIKNSAVNVLILSKDYYQSAYCLNEAGVIWFLDEVISIPVALPEIGHKEMIGFINSEYKVRRLDNEDDIAYIYDTVSERLSVPSVKSVIVLQESRKLKKRYVDYCKVGNPDFAKTEIDSNAGQSFIPYTMRKSDGYMKIEAFVMLLFAAEGDGRITVSKTLSGTSFFVGGKYNMNRSQEHREIAKWDSAVSSLLKNNYIKPESLTNTDEVFSVTQEGYSTSDGFKKSNGIDVRMSPVEIIKEFEKDPQEEVIMDPAAEEIQRLVTYNPYM